MRRQVTLVVAGAGVALAALSSVALAQSASCRDTETQPECHARLRCKADEDLEACQERLRSQASDRGDDGGGSRGDGGGRDRSDDRDRSDRGRGDDGGGRDRARGSDRGGRDDRGRSRGRRGGGRGRDRDGGGGSRSFVANKTFGMGLELGEPSGFTGKAFVSSNVAIDFGLGAIYEHYYYGDGLHLYGDVLFHPVSLASNPSFELPFYIGFGLRHWQFDYCYMDVCTFDGSTTGIRIPFGLAFDFNNAPLDLFMQLVPVIDFVDDDYYDRFGDRRHTGLDASIGLRFWFK